MTDHLFFSRMNLISPQTPNAQKIKGKRNKHPYGSIILLALIGIGLTAGSVAAVRYYDLLQSPEQPQDTAPTDPLGYAPNRQNTQVIQLPPGKQTYTFMHGTKAKGPLPRSLSIDPFTPKPDQLQQIVLTTSSETPVIAANITVVSDYKSDEHSLTREDAGTQDERWQGSWVINDAYVTRYAMKITLRTQTGVYEETMRFR